MTICKDCGRTWTAHSECHCASCCAHFTGIDAFDVHLAPVRSNDGCYDPASLERRDGGQKLFKVERASGPAWSLTNPEECDAV